MPSAIKSRPMLDREEVYYWEAFQSLHLSRPSTGFGPGAIQLSEIHSYSELMGIPPGEERHDLVHVMHAMDQAFLSKTIGKKNG